MAERLDDLTPEMRAAIGQPGPPVLHEVTTLGIRTFARAVGYTNPVYFDREAAQARGYPDLVAPPGYYGMPVYDPNSSMERWPSFESPFTRLLNGGTEDEPIERIFAGDELDAVTTIVGLRLADTRMGQTLVRTTESVFTRRADGLVVARYRLTMLMY
jgi:hypothetical protein